MLNAGPVPARLPDATNSKEAAGRIRSMMIIRITLSADVLTGDAPFQKSVS
jgi:hypothetical protein